ncbi:MAG: 1-deoxy-D-xylulose-5-phosphate synthase [Candidatus Omnitrophica bacterium]|nr:1-deoxy-D-xylulose-5-phosphate synthase [Candidatus Omnitrophota bacterium]
MYKILDTIKSPQDLKTLSFEQLDELAAELRDRIITVTSEKGGHLASSLGAVEIAIAVHYCLNSPKDKVVWDVGHQSYAHKLLTGRHENFDTLREMGGLSGFPNKNENEHDPFTCGHSSTSISSALGLSAARDILKGSNRVVAVIGDAALSTGLAFEGMNHSGQLKTNYTVILNDNEHSISRPVGAMSKYLNKVISNPLYNKFREEGEKVVKKIPKLGPSAYKAIRKFQEGMKNLLVPGIVFEELGFRYFGPIDGHNIPQLISILNNSLSLNEPVLIHAITKKGKGYQFAEDDPTTLHGVDNFDVDTGLKKKSSAGKSFMQYFGEKMVTMAGKDDKIVAITAAMKDGVGLAEFAAKYPDRFFDVGINEAHAVTFASGLATGGMKPVVAIYSTFLQRSYDQIIHDIALQKLPVVFCVDRAGLVGKDGPTHHGVFDIAYMRTIPGFVVMAPRDGFDLEMMMEAAFTFNVPVMIRYPRGEAKQIVSAASFKKIELGKSETLREGKNVVIVAVGSMVNVALQTAEILSKEKIEVGVVDARFIKPLDTVMLDKLVNQKKNIVTLEEGVVTGGFGSAVLEFLAWHNINDIKIKCLGLPDEFIEHGTQEELLRKYHLTPAEIAATLKADVL